jgi:hypothetical protein
MGRESKFAHAKFVAGMSKRNMKRFSLSKWVGMMIVLAGLTVGRAQEADAKNEIEKAIRDYLAAMSARDVDGLRTVLDKRFTIVEAAQNHAKVHLIDAGNSKALLPPEGNDDWDKDQVRLSAIKAEISASHPSVAMVSFTLTFPLSDERVAAFEGLLRQKPGEFDAARRKAVARIVADRAIHNSMFAMLARQDGIWKIVCLSLPR